MNNSPQPLSIETLLLQAATAVADYSSLVCSDPDYPALHLAPPVGRLNDPNGLVYHNGLFHAFYQYSPVHPYRAVFWRHAVSADLTHWKDDKTAIAPQNWYDRNGCYSGSGIVNEAGELEFFYTGNVKNEAGEREAYQCLFTSADEGRLFTKYAHNPLFGVPEQGYTAHFRDPHVTWREGKWWAVLGAQREDQTPAVVIYTSNDRRAWKFAHEIKFSDESLMDFGYMFECPLLFSLKDQTTGELCDVLIFCPQGIAAQGENYQNIYQCGYIVGTLREGYFDVRTPFTEFDAGFEFYAPQIFSNAPVEDNDSVTLMAWLGNAEEDEQPSWDYRWLHMMTYPREVRLDHGKLLQRPVSQLDSALPLLPEALDRSGYVKSLAQAKTFRLKTTLTVSEEPVVIKLHDSQGVAASVVVSSDAVLMDRAGSRYQAGGPLREKTLARAEQRCVEILYDGSALEIFIDGGTQAFSARIYTHGGIDAVSIVDSNGENCPQNVMNLSVARMP